MMRENKLRRILREGKTSVATRLWSTWPLYTESLGATGNFDYMEFVAEYAPFTQADLENMARAAELYEMGSMIKVEGSCFRLSGCQLRRSPDAAGGAGLHQFHPSAGGGDRRLVRLPQPPVHKQPQWRDSKGAHCAAE